MMTDGKLVEKDERRGAQLFATSCILNDARACMLWGYALETVRGTSQNLSDAHKYYERACDGRNALGCNNAGIMLHNGQGLSRDEARAMPLYQKACDLKEALGCRNLGILQANATTLTQDPTLAVVSFVKGCIFGDMDSCNRQAWHLETGTGTQRNIEQARVLYTKACNGNFELGCKNLKLFNAYYPIPTAQPRPALATAALPAAPVKQAQAAESKDAEQLYKMGNAAYEAENFVSARDYYNKSCLAGRTSSCGSLGYLTMDGKGGEKNAVKGLALLTKSCNAKDGFHCKSVGDAYAKGEGAKINAKTALKFYKQACTLGDVMGCVMAKQAK